MYVKAQVVIERRQGYYILEVVKLTNAPGFSVVLCTFSIRGFC